MTRYQDFNFDSISIRYLQSMVLLTVRTHGPVTQIVAIYRAHVRAAVQLHYTMVNYRATDQYRPNVSDDDDSTGLRPIL